MARRATQGGGGGSQVGVLLANIAEEGYAADGPVPLFQERRWGKSVKERAYEVQCIVGFRAEIARDIFLRAIRNLRAYTNHTPFLLSFNVNVNSFLDDELNPCPLWFVIKYGLEWPDNTPPLEVERYCIRKGGRWGDERGNEFGAGLFHHYSTLESILWPDDYRNRWTDWMLRLLLEETICVFAACKDSGKTRRVSKWALMDYWCFPNNTLTVMTSTTNRGLELRVWGDIKSLWQRAHDRFDWLEGNPSDSKHGIFTDSLGDDVKIRDMRKGIIGVPTMNSEESYDGAALNEFVGIKQGRRRLIGDEMQYIPADYLKVIYAMNAGDFKGAFLGNMIAENGKALDRVAEPEGGWGTEGEITKSTQWRNKYGGVTLNMIGTDSPNIDPATRNKFPGMMTQESIDRVAKLPNAKDSVEWWSQILGIRKIGVISDRVLLISDITNNGGFKDVIWASSPQRGLAIDAGFGGDDCVKTYFEFGEEVSGRMVLAFKEQSVYPVAISNTTVTPEDQIATAAKADCERYDIPYENVFIEAGMRATLAVSFGRILSPAINAINFGGTATDRPVSNDLFVFDEKTHQRRLKTCFEHYSKFVTELAFSVRDLVVCGQARLFPMRAAEEFQRRKWEFVYGDRYELETKSEYKERNASKSPNDSDSVMIAVEGAKRLGFEIEKVRDAVVVPPITVLDTNGKLVDIRLAMRKEDLKTDWLERELEAKRRFEEENELSYD